MQYNSFRTGGIVFRVCDTEFIQGQKGEFQKREIWIEVPTQAGMDNNTEILVFETIFEETSMLDAYTEGSWVDIVFKITSRRWTSPEGKEKCFNSYKLLDMKEGPNPFDKGEDIQNKPEDLSNTIVSELGDRVKDYANEPAQQDTLFDKDGNLKDDNDPLPF